MSEEDKAKAEAQFMMVRRIGQARWDEQKRTADKIEMLLFNAQSQETCDALVALAYYVLDGGRK